MNQVSIDDIEDINNAFFHFTPRVAIPSIEKRGLVADVGGASEIKDEQEKRVYLSKGAKGILAIKNSFVYTLANLSIRQIPQEYREYFGYESYDSDERIPREDVYRAISNRMKDEVYLLVDAHEGEDFFKEDIHTNIMGVQHDIKGVPNHNIAPQKLTMIKSQYGSSAYDVVRSLYERLAERNPDAVRSANSSLYEMFEYVEHGRMLEESTESLGRQVVDRYKETETIETEGYDEETYAMMEQMYGKEMSDRYKNMKQGDSQEI